MYTLCSSSHTFKRVIVMNLSVAFKKTPQQSDWCREAIDVLELDITVFGSRTVFDFQMISHSLSFSKLCEVGALSHCCCSHSAQ